MTIQLKDLNRFFADQKEVEMVEVCLTYVNTSGQERMYTFVKAISVLAAFKALHETAVCFYESMSDIEDRWQDSHGDEWKDMYQESIGHSFDDDFNREWRVRTWDEFCAIEKAEFVQVGRLHAITHEEWWDAFEALPPMYCEWNDEVLTETFLMSEFYTASYTTQYVSCKCPHLLQKLNLPAGTHVCVSRLIDTLDKATWITYRELYPWALANADEVRKQCQQEINTNNQQETHSETS